MIIEEVKRTVLSIWHYSSGIFKFDKGKKALTTNHICSAEFGYICTAALGWIETNSLLWRSHRGLRDFK
jgi:hypothetical protein